MGFEGKTSATVAIKSMGTKLQTDESKWICEIFSFTILPWLQASSVRGPPWKTYCAPSPQKSHRTTVEKPYL